MPIRKLFSEPGSIGSNFIHLCELKTHIHIRTLTDTQTRTYTHKDINFNISTTHASCCDAGVTQFYPIWTD